VQEKMDSLIDSQGEITAANVLDLADSYSSLAKMLKNTSNSAAGVAKAL
jgi:hypothetical protein